MPLEIAIRSIRARLVGEPSGLPQDSRRQRRLFRPLVVGPAVIRRDGPEASWIVRVGNDGRLLPLPPQSPGGPGGIQRVAAALVVPQDLAGGPPTLTRLAEPSASEFYGWALMYQLPGMRGLACVDPHEQFAELPAFYESPLELIDRNTFLSRRGIPARPLALITQPTDFVRGADGRLRNRFYPGQRFQPPGPSDWLD